MISVNIHLIAKFIKCIKNLRISFHGVKCQGLVTNIVAWVFCVNNVTYHGLG